MHSDATAKKFTILRNTNISKRALEWARIGVKIWSLNENNCVLDSDDCIQFKSTDGRSKLAETGILCNYCTQLNSSIVEYTMWRTNTLKRLLLSARCCGHRVATIDRSISAAGARVQQQMRLASCWEPRDEAQHRLVHFTVTEFRKYASIWHKLHNYRQEYSGVSSTGNRHGVGLYC